MSVNIFGSSGRDQSSDANRKYVDQKFDTLSTNLATKVDKAGDVMTGDLSMSGHRVTNLGSGTNPQDAVTKQYVDTVADAKITKDGDTMRGELNMNNNRIINVGPPQSDNDVASKRYCDEISRNMVSKNEGVLVGILNMNWNNIRNVNFPDYPADAVNKMYVQILYQNDEIGIEKLINICNALSPFLERDPNVQRFRTYFNSRYIHVLSLNSTIASIFKSQEVVAELIESTLLIKELKIIVLQIILALREDNFKQFAGGLLKDGFLNNTEDGTLRKRYYRIVRELKKKQSNDTQIDLIAEKNLTLIHIGYIFIDEALL